MDFSSVQAPEVASNSMSFSVGLLADTGNQNATVEPGLSAGLKILMMFESPAGTIEALYGTDTIYGSKSEFSVSMKLYNITSKLQSALNPGNLGNSGSTFAKFVPPVSSIPLSPINNIGIPSKSPNPPLPIVLYADEGVSPYQVYINAWYNGTSQNGESLSASSRTLV